MNKRSVRMVALLSVCLVASAAAPPYTPPWQTHAETDRSDLDFPLRAVIPAGGSNWTPPPPLNDGVPRGPGLMTTDLNAITPADMVNTLVGPGVTVSNIVYTGANVAGGTFTGGTGIIGFESGIILSSGNIASVPGPNVQDDVSTDNLQPGDADLEMLIPQLVTNDAAILEFDFECQGVQAIQFQYVFTSDEYNEFVDSEFNDVFAFFLNGVNIAIIPGSPLPVAINNVNCGNPFNPPFGNFCNFYRNNDLDDGGGAIDTEMDGLTVVFTAAAVVNPGVNTIKLAIADATDEIYDSNVFIRAQSFVCGIPLGACCDRCTQTCVDDVTADTCTGPDEEFFLGLTCDEIDPPCVPKPVDVKWSQPPHGMWQGFNVASDLDWQTLGQVPPLDPGPGPNIDVADDFQSNGEPITCVRWWGSYIDPAFAPGTGIGMPNGGFGACCDQTQTTCLADFVDQFTCEQTIGGIYFPGDDCTTVPCGGGGSLGACCDTSTGDCIIDNITQFDCEVNFGGAFFPGDDCSTAPCNPGVCCDPGGGCTDVPNASVCFDTFIPGVTCADIPPPCGPANPGVCCDPGGGCTDVNDPSECNDTFIAGATCADIPAPCGMPGVCCDGFGGCTDVNDPSECTDTYIAGATCADVPNPCPAPNAGVCCDPSGTTCTDVPDPSFCGPGDTFIAGVTCADIPPPCPLPNPGVCCDTGGGCTDVNDPSECGPGDVFVAGATCADIPAPCGMPGVCCDGFGGCFDVNDPSECFDTYIPGVTCADIPPPCPQPNPGVCCDPGGGCTDVNDPSECFDTFFPGVTCADLPPPCGNPGVCCDSSGGCTDVNDEFECGPDGTFIPGATCADVPPPCPTPGVCCDPADGGCTDVNDASECGPGESFIAGASCADVPPPCGNPGACCLNTSGCIDVFDASQCVDGTFVPGVSCSDVPDPCTNIDGWLVSFHSDLPANQNPPDFFSRPLDLLGLYFCPENVVTICPTGVIGWDGHEVYEYFVELENCALIHSYLDPRPGADHPMPAQERAFCETAGFIYWLDVQAVVGHTFVPGPCACNCDVNGDTLCDQGDINFMMQCLGQPGCPDVNCDGKSDLDDIAALQCLIAGGSAAACCPDPAWIEVPTPNRAFDHFWGWHTSPYEWNGESTETEVVMGPNGEWIYPNWRLVDGTPHLCQCLGDVNGDGQKNGEDIQGFTECLIGTADMTDHCDCANMNGGPIDMSDVPLFVQDLLDKAPCQRRRVNHAFELLFPTQQGACCLSATECIITTEVECVDCLDGIYIGDKTECPTQSVLVPIHTATQWSHSIETVIDCPDPNSGTAGCTDEPFEIDPWVTSDSAGTNCEDFGHPDACPVPADFFGPGSDPFTDVVCFVGVPLGPTAFGDFGEADTLVRRTQPPFDPCVLESSFPTAPSVINIEVVELSLVSAAPITVTYNGGQTPEQWTVAVSLSDVASPASVGTLTATKTHCNGGTYDSDLFVTPKFTFTRISDTFEVTLDVGDVAGCNAINMITTGDPWVHEPHPSLGVVNPVCTEFFPGIQDDNPETDPTACAADCNGNDIDDSCEPDSDGDGTIDDCDNCPNEPALIDPDEPGAELTCDDGIDNDCDGDTDCADADCAGVGGCP